MCFERGSEFIYKTGNIDLHTGTYFSVTASPPTSSPFAQSTAFEAKNVVGVSTGVIGDALWELLLESERAFEPPKACTLTPSAGRVASMVRSSEEAKGLGICGQHARWHV